jgi:hypothetical protein
MWKTGTDNKNKETKKKEESGDSEQLKPQEAI